MCIIIISLFFGKASCIYPRGILNGRCVEGCPVDTLYEYVESFIYQNIKNGYYRHNVKINQSYHRCVEECPPKYPFIGSNRICASNCLEKKMEVGHRKYCRDDNINNGFCDVNECPVHEFKCYFMQCFTNCPDFTVSYNNSCVIECFDEKPLIANGECVGQCPEEYVVENGICKITCSTGRYLFNKTCVDKCPKSNKYISELLCVSECPIQKVIQDNVCVKNCSERFVLDGNVCRIKCPSGLFEYEKLCVKTCPDSAFLENEKCVENCSIGFYRFKSHCISNCPPNYFINGSSKTCVNKCDGVSFNQNYNVFCLADCPENTATFNSTCVTHCPKSQPFLHERSCLAKCPVSFKFIDKIIETGNKITYVCVNKCRKYTSLISSTCVNACSSKEVLFGVTCQDQCPKSDPYKVHLPATQLKGKLNITLSINVSSPINAFVACATQCPLDFVMDNGECFESCPASNRSMVFNSRCFQHCPNDFPFITKEGNKSICTERCEKLQFQHKCLNKCPDSHTVIYRGECVLCSELGMFEQDKKCVNRCDIVRHKSHCYNTCPRNAKFVYNGTCIESCPQNASKVNEQLHEHKLISLLVCTDTCPTDKFIFGNKCVSNCPNSSRLPLNGKCVACYEVGKFDDGLKCVDICETLHYNNSCVNICPSYFKIFNKTCVSSCPKAAPFITFKHFEYLNLYGYACVEKCDNDEYISEKECRSYCYSDEFILKNFCVKSCPTEAPYISDTNISRGYIGRKECLIHCKDSDYSLNFTCFRRCPNGYYGYKNQCFETCPNNSPYTSHDGKCHYKCPTLRRGLTCYDKCPRGTFQFKQTCVQNCPSAKPYHYKDKCLKFCESFALQRTCYKQCPNGLFGYNKKCFVQCPPEAKYKYKWECLMECPKNTLHGLINFTCYDSCPIGQLKYLQRCIETCPKRSPYYFNGECVRYCAGYLDGLKCYKQCPTGKFGYAGKCVLRCPERASFVDNNRCVSSCPYVHDGKFNCMKACPAYYHQHGKQCKSGCPPSHPFTRSNYQSKCFDSCSFNELATENKECISRLKCFNFVYDIWCLQKCPSPTYILRSGDIRLCKSLTPVYIMICIVCVLVIITMIFWIRVVYHCIKMRQVCLYQKCYCINITSTIYLSKSCKILHPRFSLERF